MERMKRKAITKETKRADKSPSHPACAWQAQGKEPRVSKAHTHTHTDTSLPSPLWGKGAYRSGGGVGGEKAGGQHPPSTWPSSPASLYLASPETGTVFPSCPSSSLILP